METPKTGFHVTQLIKCGAMFCRFCRHTDENKRQKVALILDKLITMTIEEVEMYPSIQAKIWGNIGQVCDRIN